MGRRSGLCFSTCAGMSLAVGGGINPRDSADQSDRNAPASVSARRVEAPGSGKYFPRAMISTGVRHRAVGGYSPRIGAVLPELCPVPPSPIGGHDPLRPDHFGGGTGTSVSLHREPRPSEFSVLLYRKLEIEIFAK